MNDKSICDACHDFKLTNCNHCKDSKCLECANKFYINPQDKCVSDCGNGYYKDNSDKVTGKCTKCNNACTECTGPKITEC